MSHYNTIVLQGRLTFEPEIKELTSGKKLGKVRLACKSGRGTLFIDVDVWEDKLIDIVATLKKGEEVKVIGELRSNSWETPNGEKRMKHLVVAEDIKAISLGKQETIGFDDPFTA